VNSTVVAGSAALRRVESRELDGAEILSPVLRHAGPGSGPSKPALQLSGPVFKHGKPIVI
jgi:hypothetical protein